MISKGRDSVWDRPCVAALFTAPKSLATHLWWQTTWAMTRHSTNTHHTGAWDTLTNTTRVAYETHSHASNGLCIRQTDVDEHTPQELCMRQINTRHLICAWDTDKYHTGCMRHTSSHSPDELGTKLPDKHSPHGLCVRHAETHSPHGLCMRHLINTLTIWAVHGIR